MIIQRSVLRNPETHAKYLAARAAEQPDYDPFDQRLREEKPFRRFRHWCLYQNLYPYDAVADTHHLLVAVRKFSRSSEMTSEEREELEQIKAELAPDYDCLIENFPRFQSVPVRLHFHLIVWKSLPE